MDDLPEYLLPYTTVTTFYQVCGYCSIFVNLATIWLIQCKSDPYLLGYKYYLLALQFFSGVMNISTCLFMLPTHIPLLGGYCSGFMSTYLKLMTCHQQNVTKKVLEQITISTLLGCILYRHQAVQLHSRWTKLGFKLHCVIAVMFYIPALVLGILIGFSEAPPEYGPAILAKVRPNWLPVLKLDVMIYGGGSELEWYKDVFVYISVAQLFICGFLTAHSFYTIHSISRTSSSSFRRQRQWMITLAIQITIPVVLLFIPYVVYAKIMTNAEVGGEIEKVIANTVSCLICCYSIVNSVVLVTRTKSYLLALIGKKKLPEMSMVFTKKGVTSNVSTTKRTGI